MAQKKQNKWVAFIVLTIAAGLIYRVPYLKTVFYNPLVQAFAISNTEVGAMMSYYSLTKTILYIPAGILVDRFDNRKMLVFSLVMLAVLTFVYAMIPSMTIVYILYMLMAISNVIFWTAFVKAVRKLRSAGLHLIVVKGQLCSRLYPLKDHRISADDDLYISDAEFMACHKQLLANGLTTDTPVDELATADEVSYTKNGSPLYIELHRHLFDSSEDAHDELNHFFASLKPVETDSFLAMPPHEHLLYLILHAYKHFVRSGIGLRQFCDIGLWAREYHTEIDWQRLREQCESVHAATFAAAAFRIARDYLGIDFDLPTPWDASIDVEPLLHDTLCGGVYGSNDLTRLHSSTVTLNAVKASRTGEKSSVLSTVFPKREYLEHRYPYLKKRPYLLPVAWAQRLAHYASEKQSGADSSASSSIKLAKERIELMKRYDILD